jgi:hypothetical protein
VYKPSGTATLALTWVSLPCRPHGQNYIRRPRRVEAGAGRRARVWRRAGETGSMAGVPKSPLTPALERARALIASGDLGPAQVLLERAVELGRENLGEDEPDVLTAQRELAGVFLRSDDPMAARRMLEDAYAAGQWKLGDSDPVMLHISHDLGVVAQELGNKHEARKAFGRVAANGPAVLGEGHQFVGRARAYLGEDPSAATVRPEPAPATGPAAPSTHPSPAVTPPPAPAVTPQPAPAPVVTPQPAPSALPAPPATVEPVQNAQLTPVDRDSPVSVERGGQRPVVEGVQGHRVEGLPDPRAAIDRPTDVLPIARPWEGTPQPSVLSDQRQAATDQIQSYGTGQPPAQPQPEPPVIHQRPGYSQSGYVPDQQGYAAAQPGYGTAQADHPAGHVVAQPPGQPGYPPGQAGYPPAQHGYSGQAGHPAGQTGYAETPGYPSAQGGHAAAPAYPVGQPGYPQPDGRGATTAPGWQGTPHPGLQGTPQPGWQGAPHPGWQGAPNAAQPGVPSPVQQGTPGWPGGTPGGAVQTYPYASDGGAPAHPYQRKGRGLAVGLTVAATLAALTAVGALVVVLADREQPPAVPQATASAGPVLAGDPPSAVRLDDQGAVVELTWRDPTRGKVPFVVTMAREGQQLKPVSNVGLGKTKALVEGLNAKLEYCFAVVAVYGTDRFASSGQVCTERS